MLLCAGCVCGCKDTRIKAIHNNAATSLYPYLVVSAVAKIQELKQFTTNSRSIYAGWSCVCGCKDTRIKAIHNRFSKNTSIRVVVSAVAKIQELKQFTTLSNWKTFVAGCVCGCKDTRIKAIHNWCRRQSACRRVVSAVAKIQEFRIIPFNLVAFWFEPVCISGSCQWHEIPVTPDKAKIWPQSGVGERNGKGVRYARYLSFHSFVACRRHAFFTRDLPTPHCTHFVRLCEVTEMVCRWYTKWNEALHYCINNQVFWNVCYRNSSNHGIIHIASFFYKNAKE